MQIRRTLYLPHYTALETGDYAWLADLRILMVFVGRWDLILYDSI
jgi:hypothetical protein